MKERADLLPREGKTANWLELLEATHKRSLPVKRSTKNGHQSHWEGARPS